VLLDALVDVAKVRLVLRQPLLALRHGLGVRGRTAA